MNENLNEALEQIGDKHLEEAAHYYKRSRRSRWLGAVAAVLAVLIAWGAIWKQLTIGPSVTLPYGLAAAPALSQISQRPLRYNYAGYKRYAEAQEEWKTRKMEQFDLSEEDTDNLADYFHRSIPEFLSGEGNRAFSPLNTYLSLAMLAETADGISRGQILNLLGTGSIKKLRSQAGYIWNSHYYSDNRTTSILANALWLDDDHSYRENTVQTLADSYFASVYHGDLGSEEMNQYLRQWLDEQTGGLLKDYTQDLELNPDTAFALTSTIYFNAGWYLSYFRESCTEGIFHSPEGDVTVSYMKQYESPNFYYWGEDFGAVALKLEDGSSMWLILPDERKTVEDVLNSEEYLQMTLAPEEWENQKQIKVNMKVPKFDITCQTDLIEGMKNLGVTNVFNPQSANLSSLVDGKVYVAEMNHAVRVTMDECGVTAAAYTASEGIDTGTTAQPEVNFTVNRPFLFMVTSQDNLPLFTGVVEQP